MILGEDSEQQKEGADVSKILANGEGSSVDRAYQKVELKPSLRRLF
jgi:hypothetical protein